MNERMPIRKVATRENNWANLDTTVIAKNGAKILYNEGRPDLVVGDTLIQRIKGEGKKRFTIVDTTADLYICLHKSRYAEYIETFQKVDYKFGLDLEKAN